MDDGVTASADEMNAMTAQWRSLALDWSLSWRERRAMFPAGGEEATEPPADTEARMRILVEIGHRLRLDDLELFEWLREPSRLLNWHTPLEAMCSSLPDLRRFRSFVEQGFGS